MSFVNEKGGFHKKIAILQNDSNESLTVLRHAFLKKVENYSLQIEDFYLNKMPIIHDNEDEIDIEIEQFTDFNGGWEIDARFRQFKPRQCYSVIEYIRQLQDFFHRFGNYVLTLGYRTQTLPGDPLYLPAFPDSIVNRLYGVPRPIVPPFSNIIQQQNVNFLKSYYWFDETVAGDYKQRGYAETVDIEGNPDEYEYKDAHLISASLNADKKIQINFTKAFAYNFYLKLSDSFVRRTGFPKHLFQIIDGIDGTTVYTNIDLFLPDGVTFIAPVMLRHLANSQKAVFNSTNTIDSLDERVSIDVISVFPISAKIESLDETEQHEYLLGRFPLRETITFENTESVGIDGSLNKSEIQESFVSGMRNLTSHNPFFESNHFLNGDIRQIKIQLYTRYWNRLTKKFKRVKTDCADAVWVLNLLFSKKM